MGNMKIKSHSREKKHIVQSAICFLIVLPLVLASCQKTPDSSAVVRKGTISSYLAASPVPSGKYDAPKRWNFEERRKKLQVTINADIFIPDVERFPLLAIEPRPFDIQYAKRIMGYFQPGKEIYEYYDRTKDYYERLIIKCKQLIASAKSGPASDWGPMNPNAIQELEEYLEKAPQSVEKKAAAYAFTQQGTSCSFSAKREENGKEYMLGVYNESTNAHNYLLFNVFSDKGSITGTSRDSRYWEMDVLQNKSLEHAENLLKAMGLADYQLVHQGLGVRIPDGMLHVYPMIWNNEAYLKGAEKGHILFYAPCYEGIPKNISFTDTVDISENFAGIWQDEYVRINVGANGVEEFEWANGRGEITETLNENVSLIPFDTIKQRFVEQIFRNYGAEAYGQEYTKIIEINKITLSYRKILMPNDTSKYILIPAWDFYGRVINQFPENYRGVALERLNEKMQLVEDSFMHSYLTINAIDGAVIDNIQGY